MKYIVCLIVLLSLALSSVAKAETILSDSEIRGTSSNSITRCGVRFSFRVEVTHGWFMTGVEIRGYTEASYEGAAKSFSHYVKFKAGGVAISVDGGALSASTTSNSVTYSSGTVYSGKSHKITVAGVSFSALIFTSLTVDATGEFVGTNTTNGTGAKVVRCASDSMSVW